MIKINKIYPIDSNSKYKTIADLEDDYLEKFRVYKKPEDLLDDHLKKNPKNLTKKQLNIVKYLHNNFSKIIKANPIELERIIQHFESNKWQKEIYSNKKITPFGEIIKADFGYQERFRNNIKRGIWLAKQLNIKTCPYCNAQNTLVTDKEFGKEITKFQFDHFYSKSEYPYLSISLYNLIPCCASCNITKSNKKFNLKKHYHPYNMNLANKAKFNLKYDPNPKNLTVKNLKKLSLTIDFEPKHNDPLKIVENHEKIYHIKGVYNRHKDVGIELLKLSIIRTSMKDEYLKIRGLFGKQEDFDNFILRNYSLKKDTLKRPLAKFSQDIAKQLKII